MYVKPLETRVCIRELKWENTPRNTLIIFRQEGNLLHFEIMIQNISLFCAKWHSFPDALCFSCNTFFKTLVLKIKYPTC